MDYDDLLVYLLMLLESKPHIASQLQKDHQFIMIDEYQDTNSLQHRIVKALAGKQANVMAVGDDAQSIYSFRGAIMQIFWNSLPSSKIARSMP